MDYQHVQLKARHSRNAKDVMGRVWIRFQSALPSVNLVVAAHLTPWCTRANASLLTNALVSACSCPDTRLLLATIQQFTPPLFYHTECPIKGQTYKECKGCDGTCWNQNPICPLICDPGCSCDNGTVVHEGECIPTDKCPGECCPQTQGEKGHDRGSLHSCYKCM